MANFDESRYIVKARVNEQWKKTENNVMEDWAQGCLIIANDRDDYMRYRIQPIAGHYRFAFPINPETICKPTGQKDKNNCLIFEHDLCTVENFGTDLFEVLWDNKASGYILKRDDISLDFGSVYGNQCTVIWNGFDKQEIRKDMERTLFVGDKSEEEMEDILTDIFELEPNDLETDEEEELYAGVHNLKESLDRMLEAKTGRVNITLNREEEMEKI